MFYSIHNNIRGNDEGIQKVYRKTAEGKIKNEMNIECKIKS